MKKQRLNQDHPTVAEVRRWRAEVVKEAGGTLEGLIRMLGRSSNGSVKSKPRAARRSSPRRKSA